MVREDAKQDGQGQQDAADRLLPGGAGSQFFLVGAKVFRAQVNPLQAPENIAGRENHHRGGDDGKQDTVIPDRENDQHLPDEAAEAGKPQSGKEQADCHCRVKWHLSV